VRHETGGDNQIDRTTAEDLVSDSERRHSWRTV
jgi:hypothetical protein